MNPFLYFNQFSTGGDWLVFFPQYVQNLTWFPYIWSPTNGIGLGQNISFILGFKTFFAIEAKFFFILFDFPWSVTEKFIFFFPYWILGIVGTYFFAQNFFQKQFQKILAVIIYMLNTYALMLIGGGQMGVALAYAIVPLVLAAFWRVAHAENIMSRKSIVWTGIHIFSLSLLLLFDSRLALLVLAIVFSYLLFISLVGQSRWKMWLVVFFNLGICILLNAFWIVPTVIVHDIQVSSAYTSPNMVRFLSFATFENTISILHPNWPENIFGKVTFMRPEFLILPILAFSSLGFLKNSKKTKEKVENIAIYFFVLLGLLGAFLAKGTQEPFGNMYFWLFTHIPGFVLFRDPTKWYLLTIVSYTFLIPFSVGRIYRKIRGNTK